MRCPNCKEEMGKRIGTYQYRECGLDTVWLEDCDLLVCPKCNLRMPVLPGAAIVKEAITRTLVLSHERSSGEVIVYLRKAMGLKAYDLAEILRVNRVTLSRWENDFKPIDGFAEFQLRMEAVDKILPAAERDAMRAKVSLVLQHGYKPEQVIEKITVSVAAAAEFAAAGL